MKNKWESLGLFVKYGMMTDDKFLEKANKFHLLEDVKDETFYTLDEYKAATEAIQRNKEGKLVILYSTNPVQQDSYIHAALDRGYKVVKMETLVDAGFINTMEMKWADVQFTRIDADITDNLINKQEGGETILNTDQETILKELFTIQIPALQVSVEVKGLTPNALPVVATRPEFMRRMKDMAAMSGPMGGFYANMPDEVTLTVNGNHSIYQQILKETEKPQQEKLVRNLADLALLSQGLLKGNDLTSFINRSIELMQNKKEATVLES